MWLHGADGRDDVVRDVVEAQPVRHETLHKFVCTTRRYRTTQIQAGAHTITAADPLPADLRHTLNQIHREAGTH